ncbi:MAG TPA: GNAT family N-acetyltransferase [Tepidisphaeraceae bacterium]
MKPLPIKLRPAIAGDAESIARVHFAAVHQTAAAFYPLEVLSSWSPPADHNRVERIAQTIAAGEEVFVVCEVKGVVRGFGSIVPKSSELRAVYVDPEFTHQRIGSAITHHLEDLAASRGVKELTMDASVNAEEFYRKLGYTVVERGLHRLPSGLQMACAKMSKTLPPSPNQ